MNRRQFLILTIFSGVAASAALLGWRVSSVWWKQPHGENFLVFSDAEADIINTIANTLFPPPKYPSAEESELAAGVDRYLTLLPEFSADAVKLLLHVISDFAVAQRAGFVSFKDLPFETRVAAMRAWETSNIPQRAVVIQTIKALIGVVYFNKPAFLEKADIKLSCII